MPYFCCLKLPRREVKITAMLKRVACMVAVAAVQTLIGYYVVGSPLVPQTETAEWVARQADKRDVGKDGSFQLKMRLFDRQQRVRER